MNCPGCQFENPAGMKFCGNCGNKLNIVCRECHFENPPGFKFCGNCGNSLASKVVGTSSVTPPTKQHVQEREKGERRHLTVMFCDVVGSTELSHMLDPEDLKTIIKEYQSVCARVIGRFDGHVAQYLGDGIMAYFGYPTAHENDAHRAVSSALGILEAIGKFNQQIQEQFNLSIQVRVGIHTGHVVISQMGGGSSAQDLALGRTPNIAARLEGVAKANNVVISSATYDLISKYFNVDDLGLHELKGVADPVRIYSVVSANVAKYRYAQLIQADHKPLVGRDDEVLQLQALWDLAGEGEAQVVTLHGEPGLGKSSLVDAAMRISTEDADAWMMYHQCSEYHSNSAFYPVAQAILNGALQVTPSDSIEEKISRLEGFLLQIGYDLEEMMPLFAQIMALPLSGTIYRPSQYSPEQQRQKLVDAVLYNFLSRSHSNRLLVIFEDLQWIDPATLEIINRTIQECKGHNLLLVLTYRPEFKPGWGNAPNVTDIALRHLRRNSADELISRIAGEKKLPKELVEEIISKTDGIPLFVEELTKTILNSTLVIEKEDHYVLDKPLSQISIPSTLHDSLEARLDRMSHTKEVAQFGAAIGREFDYRLVVDASVMNEEGIRGCLAELVDAELLTQRGMPPEASYQFRHALIMDAAYASLLKSNRVIIHGRIARAMERNERYTEDAPEAVAYQFQHAQDFEKAVMFWTKAARKARVHQSYEEALIFMDKGLRLLDQVERSRRTRLEADLLEMKAPTHLALESYGSSNAYAASLRLYELGNRLDDDQARFNALRTMVTYEVFSGRPTIALKNAEDAQALADKLQSNNSKIEALRLLGQASMYVGKYTEALQSLSAAYEAYRSLEGEDDNELNRNQGILSLAQSSHCMWYLGYPDQAVSRGELAVEMAESGSPMPVLAMAYFLQCINCSYLGKWDDVLAIGAKCLKITKEYGLRMFFYEISFLKGLAIANKGELDEGVKIMKASLKWRTSVGLFSASHLQTSFLADTLISAGRYNEAQDAIDLSNKLIKTNEDQLFRSEVYRIEAILVHNTRRTEAEETVMQLLERSLQVSREQRTRSFEMRTLMTSLELIEEPRTVQAIVEQLRKVYESFSEGLDSMDLKRAKQMLNRFSDVPHASIS